MPFEWLIISNWIGWVNKVETFISAFAWFEKFGEEEIVKKMHAFNDTQNEIHKDRTEQRFLCYASVTFTDFSNNPIK